MEILNVSLLKEYRNILIFGTGESARDVVDCIRKSGLGDRIKSVLSPTPYEFTEKWGGGDCVVFENDFIRYEEDTALIICSIHYLEIYRRLLGYNKIRCVCYSMNWYCADDYYEEISPIIPYDDERYKELRGIISDQPSLTVFDRFTKYHRQKQRLIKIDENDDFGGNEDYWLSVLPVRKHKKAVIVDGGAWIGDSIGKLMGAVGCGVIEYHAFEPDKDSFSKMLDSIASLNAPRVSFNPYNAGLSNTTGELFFHQNDSGNYGSSFKSSGECESKISVMAIDDIILADDSDVFIKMDIEGSELDALKGARNTIINRHPSLAICVYHKGNDLLNIPTYLKSLVPDYRIRFCGGSHTICLAQIEK